MGLDRTIRFPGGETPTWDVIHTHLARVGVTAPLRMIDGMPAFPDETPPPDWRELRVGSAAGMMTVRRGAGVLTCVIWGNADEALIATWSRLIWACAVGGSGVIEGPSGSLSAAEFAHSVGITPA